MVPSNGEFLGEWGMGTMGMEKGEDERKGKGKGIHCSLFIQLSSEYVEIGLIFLKNALI